MNRRLTLTTGIVLTTLSMLYLGGSAYRARAPFKVDTLGDLHGLTLGRDDAPESMVVFTDYRCPHCRAFENEVMPKLEPLVVDGVIGLTVVPIGMLGEDSELTAAGALCAAGRSSLCKRTQGAFRAARRDPRGAHRASRKAWNGIATVTRVLGERLDECRGRTQHHAYQGDRHPGDTHRGAARSRLRQPD